MTASKSMREYELKFAGRAGELMAMKKAADAAAGGRASWRTAETQTIYYDTPERRLFAKGVTLRVRQSGEKCVQTVKADHSSSAAALDRAEWEQVLSGCEPDLNVLPQSARRALGTILPDELAPVVVVDMKRQKTVLVQINALGPDLEAEVAIDKGTVHAAGRSAPISECELELIGGEPSVFFQLAMEVHGNSLARLSRISKAARGFALFDETAPEAVKAPKFLLRRERSVSETFREVFGVCIANIVDNEPIAMDGKDPEGVHQIRVSIRRMRSLLAILNNRIDPERTGWLREELKWLHSSMGPARDWDVFISETLMVVDGYGIDRKQIDRLRKLAENRRAEAYRSVRETINSSRYARLTLKLTAFTEIAGWLPWPVGDNHPLVKPLRTHARSMLSRPFGKLMKGSENLADMEMEQRHEVRIRLKKLRYAVDFLHNLYPGAATTKFLKNLHRLQDQFGYLNDVAQITHMIDDLFTSGSKQVQNDPGLHAAAGLVIGWHAQHLHALEPQFLNYWDAFIQTPPFWPAKGKVGKPND